MEKNTRKILFVADGYAVGKDAGSLLYRKIIEIIGIENSIYLSIGRLTRIEWPRDFHMLLKKQLTLRIFPIGALYKVLGRLPLIETFLYFLIMPFLRIYLGIYFKNKQIDLVICVLRGDVNPFVRTIVKHTKAPLVSYISDTVEMEFSDKRLIYHCKVKEYYKAIRKSAAIFVASEKMKDFIETNFNKSTSILRMGFLDFVKSSRSLDGGLTVFFSGSVYAHEEFELFTMALSRLADKSPNVTIKLILATNYKIKTDTANIEIVNLGWVEESSLYAKMWMSHIGYIPYKFVSRFRTQSEFAFPTKAGFYLSAGLPLFFHGPSYSSMDSFYAKYECGVHCSSINIDVIVNQLEDILHNREKYNSYLINAKLAYESEFSVAVMKRSVEELLESVK